MVRRVERLTEPATFEAVHEYSPACLASAPAMLSVLRCLFMRLIVMAGSLPESRSLPAKAQPMSNGVSPFSTEQATETESPSFAGSALNAIGSSCGATFQTIRVTRGHFARLIDLNGRAGLDRGLADERKWRRVSVY